MPDADSDGDKQEAGVATGHANAKAK